MQTSIQGFPRIGVERELKFALDRHWRGSLPEDELCATAAEVRRASYAFYRECGLDFAPVDFSFYDKVLDTAVLLGVVPERFARHDLGGLALYFAMARGAVVEGDELEPLALKKWFNTNYHYLVPEIAEDQDYALDAGPLLELVDEALAEGLARPVPVLIGPGTFLALSRRTQGADPAEHARRICAAYAELLRLLAERGIEWVQLDEPALVMDPLPVPRAVFEQCYAALAEAADVRIALQTYFDGLGDAYQWVARLPVDGLGLDLVAGEETLAQIEEHGFPQDRLLFAGLVDGRNVWCLDVERCRRALERLDAHVPDERLVLSTSCSLLHVPITREGEDDLPQAVRGALAFAREKCRELQALKEGDEARLEELARRRRAFLEAAGRRNEGVRRELEELLGGAWERSAPSEERRRLQRERLDLPFLPTTTIGSFPQTPEVRRLRRDRRRGRISEDQYESGIRGLIRGVIELQERIGLDVLVHGEFERTDMVEYFGQQLDGFVFTRGGWVLSYGSRCVKPPVVYGDVAWRGPMTVAEFEHAQGLTERPVKGMLTGPVTILNWSFVRDDLPRAETCRQIALALRREVLALEAAGARAIQVDEPALREGLPLRRAARRGYLDWAVDAFRLAVGGVQPATQVHTHMCYSEFNEIIDEIIRMDADVITIENARAGNELLRAFREREYPNEIGPGVYDIHSPLVPSVEAILGRIERICEVLPAHKVWVNPDCGLKTRRNEEAVPSLEHMVEAARLARRRLSLRDT